MTLTDADLAAIAEAVAVELAASTVMAKSAGLETADAMFRVSRAAQDILTHADTIAAMEKADRDEAVATWIGTDPLRKAVWGAIGARIVPAEVVAEPAPDLEKGLMSGVKSAASSVGNFVGRKARDASLGIQNRYGRAEQASYLQGGGRARLKTAYAMNTVNYAGKTRKSRPATFADKARSGAVGVDIGRNNAHQRGVDTFHRHVATAKTAGKVAAGVGAYVGAVGAITAGAAYVDQKVRGGMTKADAAEEKPSRFTRYLRTGAAIGAGVAGASHLAGGYALNRMLGAKPGKAFTGALGYAGKGALKGGVKGAAVGAGLWALTSPFQKADGAGLGRDMPERTSDRKRGLGSDMPARTSDVKRGLGSDMPSRTHDGRRGLGSDMPGRTSDARRGLGTHSAAAYDDSKHPRGQGGKFAVKNGVPEADKSAKKGRSELGRLGRHVGIGAAAGAIGGGVVGGMAGYGIASGIDHAVGIAGSLATGRTLSATMRPGPRMALAGIVGGMGAVAGGGAGAIGGMGSYAASRIFGKADALTADALYKAAPQEFRDELTLMPRDVQEQALTDLCEMLAEFDGLAKSLEGESLEKVEATLDDYLLTGDVELKKFLPAAAMAIGRIALPYATRAIGALAARAAPAVGSAVRAGASALGSRAVAGLKNIGRTARSGVADYGRQLKRGDVNAWSNAAGSAWMAGQAFGS